MTFDGSFKLCSLPTTKHLREESLSRPVVLSLDCARNHTVVDFPSEILIFRGLGIGVLDSSPGDSVEKLGCRTQRTSRYLMHAGTRSGMLSIIPHMLSSRFCLLYLSEYIHLLTFHMVLSSNFLNFLFFFSSASLVTNAL